jgi:hypothetical protein
VPGAVLPKDHEIFLEFGAGTSSSHPAPQPAARPDTEVFLAPLTNTNGRLEVGSPVNISRNDGYDNQPFFTPDGSASCSLPSAAAPSQTSIATTLSAVPLLR